MRLKDEEGGELRTNVRATPWPRSVRKTRSLRIRAARSRVAAMCGSATMGGPESRSEVRAYVEYVLTSDGVSGQVQLRLALAQASWG